MRRARWVVLLAFVWIVMILLGSIVLETFMVYPNIFHDPPGSLALAMEFMAVRAPNDFFPPLGFLSWVAGAGTLALGWRVRPARWWILLSVLMIVGEGLVSMLFMWPRNEIMFVEGTAVHSAEVLRQTAAEFQALHWSRLAFNAVSAASIFAGFMTFYRQRILSQVADATAREAISGSHAERRSRAAVHMPETLFASATTR